MVTINDIARECGVSHGTVSNVINRRGNVSVEKMRLVWQTAEKLGYKVNSKAQSLRQGATKTIAVLLPSIDNPRYATMYEVFQREFLENGYAVQLFSTGYMENTERTMLTSALNARVCAVITSSCLAGAVDFYRTETVDLPLVFLQRGGPNSNDVMYADFDPEQSGADMAGWLKNNKASSIGVFSGDEAFPNNALFLKGFRKVYPPDDTAVTVVSCPEHQIELQAFSFFENDAYYTDIVCTDLRRAAAIHAAHAYGSRKPAPRIITPASTAAITNPEALVYELDDKLLAHRIVKALVARLEQKENLPQTLYLKNSGFRTPVTGTGSAGVHLRLLTFASPSTAALTSMLPNLEKTTGLHLDITVLPSLKDVYDTIQSPAAGQYDLIRMDVAWMDELAERLFTPLYQIDFDWNALLEKVIPELGDHYTSARGTRYCVPFDPSTQLLFYRNDLFTDPILKRIYYERYHTELTAPTSFAEYNQIAGFFTHSKSDFSPVPYGSTIAIGNVVVSPSEFMPRLFEQGGHLLDSKGRITLNTIQAEKALQSYAETYNYSDRSIYDVWKNALQGFADGAAAMTIVFINYASVILYSGKSSAIDQLGFAPVPGDKPLLGGGVIGITKDCPQPAAACCFLSWLYSDLVAPVFTMLGGLSPCRSSYSNRDVNERYPWLSTARRNFPSAQRRGNSLYYSNFSELQLETILASGIQKAVLGSESAQEALAQAQAECARYFKVKK